MKLNSFTLAALIVMLLFGGIGVSSALNLWQTETTKTPFKYTSGEAAGQYNPADIRGSYTFGDINRLFEIPLEDLQVAFRIPAETNVAAYQVKSLEEQFAELPVEMGTGAVRMFVAFYKGLPYDLSGDEESYLFPEAAEILQRQNKLRPEQSAYLQSHILSETVVDAASPAQPTATPVNTQVAGTEVEATTVPTTAPTEHTEPDRKVSGKTTFQDLLDWGVRQDKIEEILGGAMPPAQTVIKDYLSLKGLEFSSLKTQFQTEVDLHK